MNRFGKVETTVREFDEAGRLMSETVTTIVEKPVVQRPAGFRTPARQSSEEGDPK